VKRVYRVVARLLLAAFACSGAACASAPVAGAWTPELAPTTIEGRTPAETDVLARLAQLPVDESVVVSGLHVVAATPYEAASGRTCRELQLDQQPRLACDGPDGWVFVPVLIEGP
jgi:hypothetical protein